MATSSSLKREEEYEQSHVHNVYNSIASHFSQTRYKPWPVVDQFLHDLAPGNIGVDIGCGNGKYLAVRDDTFMIGSDRSDELVNIAKQHKRHDALVGDALNPPHPVGRFDFAISIAVLHHLSTRERRIQGVRAALNLLRSPTITDTRDGQVDQREDSSRDQHTSGQALFFVWALEQKGSRRGWEEGGEQDVLVPWVLKTPQQSSRQSKPEEKTRKAGKKNTKEPAVGKEPRSHRNDHTPSDVCRGGGLDKEMVHSTGNNLESEIPKDKTGQEATEKKSQVYQRYYHLYRQGELEEDIISAGGEVIKNGYDRDNWWCIATRKTT